MNGRPTLLLLGLLGLSKHSYFAAYIIEETLVMHYIMDIEEKQISEKENPQELRPWQIQPYTGSYSKLKQGLWLLLILEVEKNSSK